MRRRKVNALSLTMVKPVSTLCAKTSATACGTRNMLLIVLGSTMLGLSACGENEEHVLQMRQLREKLVAMEKRAAEAAFELEAARKAPPPKDTTGDTAQKLAAAETRAAALEQELQAARKAAPPPTSGGSTPDSVESFKRLLKQMQADLQRKTQELADVIAQELPAANIEETTLKRLRPPAEIASAFQSAVVFTLTDASGQRRVLEFPVQAGLDGQWRMPGLADVRQHITAPTVTAAATPPPSMPQNVGHPTVAAPATPALPGGTGPAGAGATPTVVIQWEKAASRTAPAATATALPATPATSTAAVSPRPAPPATPAVPKPIMPVQQDVQIRFE